MTNLEAVQGGLRIVRDALTPLVARTLRSEYGEDWWKKGVLDALVADGKPITDRPEQGDAGDLDLQTALKIVQVYHWELFSDTLDWNGRQRTLLAAITGVRNQYEGHVTPNREAELTDTTVRDLMGGMESFLLLFDRKAADQLGRLMERWKAPEPELEEEEEPVILARKVMETHRSQPERVRVSTLREERPAPPRTDPRPMHPILGSAPAHPVTGREASAPELPRPKEEAHGFAPSIIRAPKKENRDIPLPKMGGDAPRAAVRKPAAPAHAAAPEGVKSTNPVSRLPKDEPDMQESAAPIAKEYAVPAERAEERPETAGEKPCWSRAQGVDSPAAARRLNPMEEVRVEPPAVKTGSAAGPAVRRAPAPERAAEERPSFPEGEMPEVQLYVPTVPRRTPRRHRQEPVEVRVAASGKRRDIQAKAIEKPAPPERKHLRPRALVRVILCGIAALILGVALFILDQHLG